MKRLDPLTVVTMMGILVVMIAAGVLLGSSKAFPETISNTNNVILSGTKDLSARLSYLTSVRDSSSDVHRTQNDKKETKTSTLKPNTSSQVLGSHIRAGKLSINTNTAIAGTLEVGGDIVLTGRLLGEGFVSSVIAGDNVTVTQRSNDDGSVSPIISVAIPTSVTSFQGSTGAVTLTAGTGITIDGTKITSSAKLSDIRSAGGCSGCITNDDVANDLTISSSGSVDVGALSGKVSETKGGTNQSTYTTGDILYSSASNILSKLGIGTAGQVLTVSGGIPAWADSGAGVSSLNSLTGALTISGTSNQISVSSSGTSITLSAPQSIGTSSSPAFSGLTLSGLNSAGIVHTDVNGLLSTSAIVNADVSSSAAIAYSKLNLASSITGSDLASILGVSYGGTGGATAADARVALGLVIGTDVQAYNSKLTDIAALAASSGNIIVGNGTTWVAESGATARASLGLGSLSTQNASSVSVTGGAIDGTTNENTYSISKTNATDLKITGQSSAPVSPSEGQVYYDSTNKEFYGYKNAKWSKLTASDRGSCPTGYILVPGSAAFGTNDFCIMKYEAKKDGSKNPVSEAAGTPWVSVDWYEARAACQRAGAHLVTNAQWMTVARNIESTTINDMDADAALQLATGHSDNSPANSLASTAGADPVVSGCNLNANMEDASNAYSGGSCEVKGSGAGGSTDADKGYYGTGQSWSDTGYSAGAANKSQLRTHILSNGNVIWDFAGNVWEWNDWQCGTGTWYSLGSWSEWNNANLTDYEQSAGGSTSNTSANGTGKYYGCTANGNAALRGGYWDEWRGWRSFYSGFEQCPIGCLHLRWVSLRTVIFV